MNDNTLTELQQETENVLNSLQRNIAKLEKELSNIQDKISELAEQIKTTNSEI